MKRNTQTEPTGYLSVCSGIEAASVAWRGQNRRPVAFCEIEPFPSAVLKHHWPEVPNLGDMTRFREWPEHLLADTGLLVGGTPCQAFSVAGLRNSLSDERGNLTLTYVKLLDTIDATRARHGRPPAVCVWENVPGVLSTGDNAFGCFLAALAGECVPLLPPGGRWTDAGYVRGPVRSVAWRCLDAQYFGLAQRRERVFVIAGAGEGFHPEAVLFESEGVRRDSPPRREAGEGTSSNPENGSHWCGGPHPSLSQSHNAGGIGMSNQELFSQGGAGLVPEIATPLTAGMAASGCRMPHEQGALIPEIAGCLQHRDHKGADSDTKPGHLIPVLLDRANEPATTLDAIAFKPSHFTRGKDGAPSDLFPPLSADADKGDQEAVVCVNTGTGYYQERSSCGTLSASPRDAHENNLLCVHGTQDPCVDPHLAFALGRNSGQENAVMQGSDMYNGTLTGQVAATLSINSGDGTSCGPSVFTGYAVRRLTPTECERLQGFPDGHTRIPTWTGWRKMDATETPESCAAEGLEIRQNKKTGRWSVRDVDGPRYKALGNSMAVLVMLWIGLRLRRIAGI